MWKKLRELLFRKPPVEMDHEFFGSIVFMGEDKPADDDYWESELAIADNPKPVTVLINAPVTGPEDSQVIFCQQALSDPDGLFGRCWPVFEPDFEQWTGKAFGGDWRDDFVLISIEIPRNGDESHQWAVCYYVDAASHYFTARFVAGRPAFNEIDG